MTITANELEKSARIHGNRFLQARRSGKTATNAMMSPFSISSFVRGALYAREVLEYDKLCETILALEKEVESLRAK